MTETRTKLVPILVRKNCSSCTIGRMELTGRALLVNPPKYVHKCDVCEQEESYEKSYPFVVYEADGDEVIVDDDDKQYEPDELYDPIQEDRIKASEYFDSFGEPIKAMNALLGNMDDLPTVQNFAKIRLSK